MTVIDMQETPALVRSLKTKVIEFLERRVQILFENADDFLFELSGNSGDGEKQGTYFDALRQLRLRKQDMLELLRNKFNELYAKAVAGEYPGGGDGHDGNGSGLKLVDNDTLEESLAITNMVQRAHNRFGDALYAIEQRFGHLLGDVEIEKYCSPLDPSVFGEAFRASMTVLDSEITLESRLVLYKLFDRYVMQALSELYNDINETFMKSGILPQIKIKIQKQDSPAHWQSSPPSHPSPTGDPAGQDGLSETVADVVPSPPPVMTGGGAFEQLLQLLARDWRGGSGDALDGGTSDGCFRIPGASVAIARPQVSAEKATVDLVQSLSLLQTSDKWQEVLSEYRDSGIPLSAAFVNSIGAVRGDTEATAVNDMDAQTIDIVGMLFEYILDDDNVPASMRALIARLQFPVLKVAILNKTFFNQEDHPARVLLNELSNAALGWQESEQPENDPLYQSIEKIVERIIKEFNNDVEIFNEAIVQLRQVVEQEAARAKQEAVDIEQIRQDVAVAVESRIAHEALPSFVHTVLVGPWKRYLMIVREKYGARSGHWQQALDVIDNLIWSLKPKTTHVDRVKMAKLLPKLLMNLRNGLREADYDETRIDTFISALEPLHLAALRKPGTESPKNHTAEPEEQQKSSADSIPRPPPEIEELLGGKKTEVPELSEDDPMTQQAREIVANLATGDWVEFIHENNKTVRGKLIWFSELFDDYTFANRRFKVVAEKNKAQLTADFALGKARLVEKIPLIDRALNAVIMRLKH